MNKTLTATDRNPILALPCMNDLRDIMAQHPEVRVVLERFLTDLSKQCHEQADYKWRKRKPPVAAYYRSMAVYARHLRLALRPPKPAKKSNP